jgi:hypothetical protein
MGTRGCLIKGASFGTVLPRLVSAYEQGQLVPFFGAGLSHPTCHLWAPFVKKLSQEAGIAFEAEDTTSADALAMQANKAVARLRASGTDKGCSRLIVVRGPLKPPIDSDTCLAVSAGGSGDGFYFSKPIDGLLQAAKVVDRRPALLGERKYVARFGERGVFAVRPREGGSIRALRVIRPASLELFEAAYESGFRRICMQVFASGGSDSSQSGFDVQLRIRPIRT